MNASDNVNPTEQCLAMIAASTDAFYSGNDRTAEGSLQIALMLAKRAPSNEQQDLTALALCHLSLLRKRQGRMDEARQFREQAKARFEDATQFMPVAVFHHLMASALMELAEYQQAIPLWEQAVLLKRDDTGPAAIANDLWRVGECYSRVGLKDQRCNSVAPP